MRKYFKQLFLGVLLLFTGFLAFSTIVHANEGEGEITFAFHYQEVDAELDEVLFGTPEQSKEETHPVGVEIHHIEVPTHEYYSFAGWYYTNEDGQYVRLKRLDIFDVSTEFYAKWVLGPYIIDYVLNGGTNGVNPGFAYADKEVLLQPATKDNHTFLGWYDNAGFDGEEITKLEHGQKSLTLYAKFDEVRHTVTFNTNGGTAINPQSILNNDLVVQPDTPLKEGYTFVEWRLEDVKYDFDTPVTDDIDLVAYYTANDYTITFDSNEGSAVDPITKAYGEEVTAPANPTRDGYEFKGWFVSLEDEEAYVFNTMPLGGVELVAKWEVNDYTITFDSNGGLEVDSITKAYGEEVTLPEATREGYNFLGWFLDLEDEEAQVVEAMPLNGLSLVAKWDPISYTITFNDTYELENDNVKSYTIEDEVTLLPLDNRDSHKFIGWHDGVGLIETINKGTTVNITLTAIWEINTYTVTFDVEGTLTTVDVNHGSKADLPEAPEKVGHDFVGWLLGEEAFDENTLITKPITLTAKFEAKSYDVTFKVEGKEDVVVPVKYGQKVEKPADPEIEGQFFNGWFEEEATEQYDFDTLIEGNLTLIAVFGQITYTVKFYDINGLELTNLEASVLHGGTIEAPTAPNVEGHDFVKWLLEEEAFDFSTQILDDLELHAEYKINQYTISFDSGVSSITQDYGTTVVAPTAPTKDGYTFEGWLLGEETYVFTTMPAEDISLVADWKAVTYTINYENTYELENDNETSYTIESEDITLLPLGERDSHTFGGWYDANDNLVEVITKGSFGNLTLTAKWNIKTYTVIYYNEAEEPHITMEDVEHGTTIDVPALIEKTGYEANWDLDLTNEPITEHKEVYIVYTINQYTISFDSGVTSITQDYDTPVVAPTAPTKDGYTFEGWLLDEEVYVFTTMPAEDISLVADWKLEEYTLTYVLYEDGVTPSDQAEFGKTEVKFDIHTGEITLAIPGERESADFIGWYLDENLVTVIPENTLEDVTVVAKWETKTYKVTINYNNGDEDNIIDGILHASELLDYLNETPTKEGYKFVNWMDVDTGQAIVESTPIIRNHTIYVLWEEIIYVRDAVINYDFSELGGTNESTEVTNIESISSVFEHEYFDEVSNASKVYFGANRIKFGTSSLTASLTLVFNENVLIETIVFYVDGWTNSDKLKVNNKVRDLSIGVPIDKGERIEITLDKPTNEIIINIDKRALLYGMELYGPDATVVVPVYHTVTFDTAGGNNIDSVTVLDGETIAKPAAPTKKGHTFIEWQYDEEEFDFATEITEDITLVAVWEEHEKYNITFVANGGEPAPDSVEVYEGEKIPLPTNPEKDDYTFIGWYLEDNVDGTPWNFTSDVVDSQIILYAQYIATGNFEERLIYETGFESNEGFTAGNAYNTTVTQGPEGEKWNIYYGTSSTTNRISGSQSLQMRWYTSATSNLGRATTEFKLNPSKITFSAKRANGSDMKLLVSYSYDGTTYHTVDTFTIETALSNNTVMFPQLTGDVYIRFELSLEDLSNPRETTSIIIDDVKIYGMVPALSDSEKIDEAFDDLQIGYSTNDDVNNVTQNLVLATEGTYDSTISWVSDNPAIDASTGVVTRPAYGQENVDVKLTATIAIGEETRTKLFTVIVKAKETDPNDDVEKDSYFEGFEGDTELGTAYTVGSFNSGDAIFTYGESRNEDAYAISGKGLMLRRGSDSHVTVTLENGLSEFSFEFRKAFTGGSTRTLEVYINDVLIGEYTVQSGGGADDTVSIVSLKDLNYEGTVVVKVKPKTAGNHQITVDNFGWTNNPK